MKFLKCLIAFKGRNFTSESAFNDNQNITQSWVMRPGDFFTITQFNYRGNGPTESSVYNANHTRGDFLGRLTYFNQNTDANNPDTINVFAWHISCFEDNNGELYLKIRSFSPKLYPESISHPVQMSEVIQDSIEKRIQFWTDLKSAIHQLTTGATSVDWNIVNQPVPTGQYLNSNGLIRNTRLVNNRYYGADVNNGTDTTGTASLSSQINSFSGWSEDLIQSYIDIENRIDHFLRTCGETQSSGTLSASQITSNYHFPTASSFSKQAVWCGGLYAAPPSTTTVSGSTQSYCRSILSIKCGAGRTPNYISDLPGNKGYYNCVDEHNNLCGWCIPYTRAEQFLTSNWPTVDNTFPGYKAGILLNDGFGFVTIHTCLQEILFYSVNAGFQMQNTGLTNPIEGDIPPLAITNDINSLNAHLSLRWGTISNNYNIDDKPRLFAQCNSFFGVNESGFTQSLRDIGESSSGFYGTWGSYGILVSTFETNNGGNDVNDSTQIYSPIHCLIMPSMTSDWPALDIYGINKSRDVMAAGGMNHYEQDEGCFVFRTINYKRTEDGGPNQGPAAGAKVINEVDIYKTIAMSTPNHQTQDITPI